MHPLKAFLTTCLLCLFVLPLTGKDVVVIADKNLPRSQKEALLILPGFGSKIHGSKAQKRYFANKGYDLFIPSYISRKSVAATVKNVDEFYQKHHLGEYKKVHVFGYIVGSWAVNLWIKAHPENNIATIIYDRSPLQERAPAALVKDMPVLIKILAGPMMKDFSRTPYPSLDRKNIRIGLLIESKATKLIRRHKKSALSLGPVQWDLIPFRQTADDAHYTWLNHDDMYSRFDVVGPEIWHFIQHGRFSEAARRVPFTDDPFIPVKKQQPR